MGSGQTKLNLVRKTFSRVLLQYWDWDWDFVVSVVGEEIWDMVFFLLDSLFSAYNFVFYY